MFFKEFWRRWVSFELWYEMWELVCWEESWLMILLREVNFVLMEIFFLVCLFCVFVFFRCLLLVRLMKCSLLFVVIEMFWLVMVLRGMEKCFLVFVGVWYLFLCWMRLSENMVCDWEDFVLMVVVLVWWIVELKLSVFMRFLIELIFIWCKLVRMMFFLIFLWMVILLCFFNGVELEISRFCSCLL